MAVSAKSDALGSGRDLEAIGRAETKVSTVPGTVSAVMFLSSPVSLFSRWWALGGALRSASDDAFLVGLGPSPWQGRAVGGRGVCGSCFILV